MPRHKFTKLLLAATGFFAMVAAAGASLSDLQWENRVVLVFAPSATDLRSQTVRESTAGFADEIRDRDLRIFILPQGGAPEETGNGPQTPAVKLNGPELRRRYNVENQDFTIVLIGKDGGAKLTTGDPQAFEAIFAEIDSMPMRRREMKNDSN